MPVVYYGDESDESVPGSAGDDFMIGQGGNDTLIGFGGNDYLNGNDGADSIGGGEGDDQLFANYGLITDFYSNDTLIGGGGDDRLAEATMRTGTQLLGGTGTDTADLELVYNDNRSIAFTLTEGGGYAYADGSRRTYVEGCEKLYLQSWGGIDNITGGALNDTIFTAGNDDTLNGEGGDDLLDGGTGRNVFNGGDGFDEASFDASSATTGLNVFVAPTVDLGAYGVLNSIERFGSIAFGSGADTLNAGAGGGVFSGNGGDDHLESDGGYSVLYGGTGADILIGDNILDADYSSAGSESAATAADDTLKGGDGDNTLRGGWGADLLDGGGGNDRLVYLMNSAAPDLKVDTFTGGSGLDTLVVDLHAASGVAVTVHADGKTATAAADAGMLLKATAEAVEVLTAGAASDEILLADAADMVSSARGADTVTTAGGDDVVFLVADGQDDVDLGGGDDRLVLSAQDAGDTTFGSRYVGGQGVDTLYIRDSADFIVTGKKVTIDGDVVGNLVGFEQRGFISSDASTSFTGTNAAEEIWMGYGTDTVAAGGGDDTVAGGDSPWDSLDGGAGIDTVNFSDHVIDGDHTIVLAGANETAVVLTGGFFDNGGYIKNFENVIGSWWNDSITGDGKDNRLDGGLGFDTLIGGGGDDTLTDISGAESMLGGDGNDLIVGTAAREAPSYWSSATDRFELLPFELGRDYADTIDSGKGVDTLSYAAAEKTVTVDLDGKEWVFAREAGSEKDKVRNVENLIGGSAGDKLSGDANVNLLAGGLGNDTLAGEGSDDVFLFDTKPNAARNADLVTDFGGGDSIHLALTVFAKLGGLGVLNADAFHASADGVAHDASDRIIYDTDDGTLTYDANGSRAGGAVVFATLDPGLSLVADDFLVV